MVELIWFYLFSDVGWSLHSPGWLCLGFGRNSGGHWGLWGGDSPDENQT